MNLPNNENRKLLIWSLTAALIILAVWAGSGYALFYFFPEPDAHGTFGDMFGAVNALFSGWAFLGVIIAIILQKRELEEQRSEIRHAREAHETSALALQRQTEMTRFITQIEAMNHVIDALASRIKRTENYRTEKEREQHDRLMAERDQYEDRLRFIIDEYLSAITRD